MPNLTNDQRIKVLTDVAAVVASSAYTLTARDLALPDSVYMHVVVRGSCTFTCALEGSYDNSTWESVGSVTAAGTVTSTDCPFTYVRANVSAFTAAAPGNNISVSLRTFGEKAATLQPTTIRLRTANGGYMEYGSNSELLTLSTSGATTDTTANLLPANSIIDAVVARVTTTITTATDWKLGDATTAARFTAADSTMTAGETVVGLAHQQGSITTDAAGPVQVAAAKVRVTTTLTPAAGAIRITVFYKKFVGPTS